MPTSKTGKNGSRVTQKKRKQQGRPPTKRTLTIDDFDLNVHANGNKVDPVEGREARLPYVIRGMRQNKSVREIAFECECAPSTISLDKKWVLEEAWTLRQDMIGLWLEEQLQGYEHFLSLLNRELQIELLEKKGEGKGVRWEPKKDKEGNPILVINRAILDKMLAVMDKVNELKGLKQVPVMLGLNVGDNANINIGQDANTARELLDVLQSGKVGRGKTPLIS